jgi:predicted nucleic acid-binding protein
VTDFVLDASVALSWFIDHPVAPYAERVRQSLSNGSRAAVPGLWRLEVPNGFAVAERRRILTLSDIAQAIQKCEALLQKSIDTFNDPISLRKVLGTARQFRLTTYDACYLDLALDLRLPLATLDRRLGEAAVKAGIGLFS